MRTRTIIIMEKEVAEDEQELARSVLQNQETIEQAKRYIWEAANDLFGEKGLMIKVEMELLEEDE